MRAGAPSAPAAAGGFGARARHPAARSNRRCVAAPWAERNNGNRPGEYARAWRHVHDIFTDEGATNVRWVWSPVTGEVSRSQYPGDRYVDVLGMSGFNGGTVLDWNGWVTFHDAFDEPLQRLHALALDKPVQISEVATADEGGSKPLWIAAMFEYIEERSWIRDLLWFDLPKQADWRVATTPAAARAFAAGVAHMQQPEPESEPSRASASGARTVDSTERCQCRLETKKCSSTVEPLRVCTALSLALLNIGGDTKHLVLVRPTVPRAGSRRSPPRPWVGLLPTPVVRFAVLTHECQSVRSASQSPLKTMACTGTSMP